MDEVRRVPLNSLSNVLLCAWYVILGNSTQTVSGTCIEGIEVWELPLTL